MRTAFRAVLAAAVWAAALPVLAQSPNTSSLIVVVEDPQGAVVPEAAVSLTNPNTRPLLNSAFRQGKGTGDLFVNATYFITGVGSRRATSFTLDGANNDEGWGRQTAIATVPLGAIKEIQVLSNAFASEFGWTSGPALNIV